MIPPSSVAVAAGNLKATFTFGLSPFPVIVTVGALVYPAPFESNSIPRICFGG